VCADEQRTDQGGAIAAVTTQASSAMSPSTKLAFLAPSMMGVVIALEGLR
jgi:hypothetical protein